jgi:hypothetical protein
MITRFTHRYLNPAESLLEILFGLIMALTITVGARLVWHEDPMTARELTLAMFGCNLAWGVIDAMFYLLSARYRRNQMAHLSGRLRMTRTDTEALALIEREIDVDTAVLTDSADQNELRELLARVLRRASSARAENTRDDLAAAVTVCVLVAASAIPGVLPLLLLDNTELGLKVANAVLVALLFWTGYTWAAYAGAKKLRTGAAVALLGIALVAIAVVLGG